MLRCARRARSAHGGRGGGVSLFPRTSLTGQSAHMARPYGSTKAPVRTALAVSMIRSVVIIVLSLHAAVAGATHDREAQRGDPEDRGDSASEVDRAAELKRTMIDEQRHRAHDQQTRGGDSCTHEPTREYSARGAGAAGREEEGRQTELRAVDRSVARIGERPDQRRVAERGRFEGDAAEHRHAEQRERDGEQASAAGGDREPRLVARPGREVPPDAAEEPEVAEHREAGDVATDEERPPLLDQHRGDRTDRVVGLGGRPGQEEGDRHEDHEGDATGGVELPRSRAGHLAVAYHTVVLYTRRSYGTGRRGRSGRRSHRRRSHPKRGAAALRRARCRSDLDP